MSNRRRVAGAIAELAVAVEPPTLDRVVGQDGACGERLRAGHDLPDATECHRGRRMPVRHIGSTQPQLTEDVVAPALERAVRQQGAGMVVAGYELRDASATRCP